jgi:DNA-binding winged helix-turn-helix (wHTH) protein/TolB-like protein/Tfp pilus assembly protein PilF
MPEQTELMKGFRIGQWTVLPERGLLREDIGEEHLEPKVMQVLVRLAAANGNVVSKQQLMDEVWGDSPSGDEVITRCIAVLRGAFQDDARHPEIIETLSRRGYRLMIPIVTVDQTPIVEIETERNFARIGWAAAGLLLLAMVVWLLWGPEPPRTDGDINSVAVFSFECQGTLDEDDQYLCSGISDVLISSLVETGNLRVVKIRSEIGDRDPQELASDLGVDGLITGTVNHLDGRYQISGSLISGIDGATIWADSIGTAPDQLFDSQEQLAQGLRRELLGAVAGPSQTARRPSSSQAFDHYLRGQYQLERRSRASIEEAIRLFEDTISLDPQFSPAYLRQAYAYLILPDYAPELVDTQLFKLAEVTIAAGIEVDAGLEVQGQTVHAYLHQKAGEWQLAADAFAAATASDSADPIAHSWHSRFLATTGRLDESLAAAQRAMQMDPNSPVIISRVAIANFWVGNIKEAELYFGMVEQMTFAAPIHDLAYALFLIRQSRVDDARSHAKDGLEKNGLDASWIDPVFDGIEDPAKSAEARALVERMSEANLLPRSVVLTLWMIFGETDKAMEAALELKAADEIFELESVFSDAFRPLREHPNFPLLLEQTGLSEYWQSIGCEWTDQALNCP